MNVKRLLLVLLLFFMQQSFAFSIEKIKLTVKGGANLDEERSKNEGKVLSGAEIGGKFYTVKAAFAGEHLGKTNDVRAVMGGEADLSDIRVFPVRILLGNLSFASSYSDLKKADKGFKPSITSYPTSNPISKSVSVSLPSFSASKSAASVFAFASGFSFKGKRKQLEFLGAFNTNSDLLFSISGKLHGKNGIGADFAFNSAKIMQSKKEKSRLLEEGNFHLSPEFSFTSPYVRSRFVLHFFQNHSEVFNATSLSEVSVGTKPFSINSTLFAYLLDGDKIFLRTRGKCTALSATISPVTHLHFEKCDFSLASFFAIEDDGPKRFREINGACGIKAETSFKSAVSLKSSFSIKDIHLAHTMEDFFSGTALSFGEAMKPSIFTMKIGVTKEGKMKCAFSALLEGSIKDEGIKKWEVQGDFRVLKDKSSSLELNMKGKFTHQLKSKLCKIGGEAALSWVRRALILKANLALSYAFYY